MVKLHRSVEEQKSILAKLTALEFHRFTTSEPNFCKNVKCFSDFLKFSEVDIFRNTAVFCFRAGPFNQCARERLHLHCDAAPVCVRPTEGNTPSGSPPFIVTCPICAGLHRAGSNLSWVRRTAGRDILLRISSRRLEVTVNR